MEMVTIHDGGSIPGQYQAFVDVSSKDKVETLPLHRPIDLTIDLELDYTLQERLITHHPQLELKNFMVYIATNLERGSSCSHHPCQYCQSCLNREWLEHYSWLAMMKLSKSARSRVDTTFLQSQNCLMEFVKSSSLLKWTSGMPKSSSESNKAMRPGSPSEQATVSLNLK